MGASCGSVDESVSEAEFKTVGLASQHAYSVLDIQQVYNNRYMYDIEHICVYGSKQVVQTTALDFHFMFRTQRYSKLQLNNVVDELN